MTVTPVVTAGSAIGAGAPVVVAAGRAARTWANVGDDGATHGCELTLTSMTNRQAST